MVIIGITMKMAKLQFGSNKNIKSGVNGVIAPLFCVKIVKVVLFFCKNLRYRLVCGIIKRNKKGKKIINANTIKLSFIGNK